MLNPLASELKRSKYRLLGLVGQGQFGRVYCASHRKTGRLVALKDLDRARFPTHKFLRELRFLLSLQHTNIVSCYALEHSLAGRYLVMDYCEGGTLRGVMEGEPQLHPAQGLKLVADVLAGLEHAHSKGIIHCDIKPENILLSLQPSGWIARISDFGISRLIQENSTGGVSNTGSPAYMAPERFYGQHSHSSDLYAVGVLLFELLVGYRPFSGLPAELMNAHLNKPVRIPETVPIELQEVILTALQKLKARRFPSATAMLAALRSAAAAAGWDLEQRSTHPPLLQPGSWAPAHPLVSLRQEAIDGKIQHLVVDLPDSTQKGHLQDGEMPQERVYWATPDRVAAQIYPGGLLEPGSSQAVSGAGLTEPVRELLLRPQGCFVVTDRALYLLPKTAGASPHLDEALSGLSAATPRVLARFEREFLLAIEAGGHWFSTAVSQPGEGVAALGVWQLPTKKSMHTPVLCPQPFRLLALDRRHLLTLSYPRHNSPGSSGEARALGLPPGESRLGTVIRVYARRGRLMGSLTIPVVVDQVVGSHSPYQLLATEGGNSNSLLLINLKPLKTNRIGLESPPRLMAPTPWGWVLVDTGDRIVLLDEYGQGVGRIAAPVGATAIAPFGNHGLLLATWNNGRGVLHTIDLREAGLDFMF